MDKPQEFTGISVVHWVDPSTPHWLRWVIRKLFEFADPGTRVYILDDPEER
jgi:hypothetical protein